MIFENYSNPINMHMFFVILFGWMLLFLQDSCVTVLSIISKVDSQIDWRYNNMNTSASCNDKTPTDKDKNDQCHIIYRNLGV